MYLHILLHIYILKWISILVFSHKNTHVKETSQNLISTTDRDKRNHVVVMCISFFLIHSPLEKIHSVTNEWPLGLVLCELTEKECSEFYFIFCNTVPFISNVFFQRCKGYGLENICTSFISANIRNSEGVKLILYSGYVSNML